MQTQNTQIKTENDPGKPPPTPVPPPSPGKGKGPVPGGNDRPPQMRLSPEFVSVPDFERCRLH